MLINDNKLEEAALVKWTVNFRPETLNNNKIHTYIHTALSTAN
jgi:hypothetical protein